MKSVKLPEPSLVVVMMPDGDWEVPMSVVQSNWELERARYELARDPHDGSDDGVPPGWPATWAEFVLDWNEVESYVCECMRWEDVKEHAALRPGTAPVPEYEKEWKDACFMVQRKSAVEST